MNGAPKINNSTTLVLFGATGDLVARKILPALFKLYDGGFLPEKFRVVGFSRRDITEAGFHAHIAKMFEKYNGPMVSERWPSFVRLFSHKKGLFENKKDYKKLGATLKNIDKEFGAKTHKLFYLAVSPEMYEPILRNLASSSLAFDKNGNQNRGRVLVEKPFGKDLKTARKLDRLLGKLFREDQIHRIDHYLAKEMIQNILSLRFSNNLFESNWNKKHIEKIEIRAIEHIGVEDRGNLYDSMGALRDFGQNHLLQMLALITMDHPEVLDAKSIRKQRAKILKSLVSPDRDYISKHTFRAQYEGYRNIPGVNPESNIETYFRIKAFLKTPRFKGVPIILESGKRLGKSMKDITITFKHPNPCLCAGNNHHKNKIIISLEPKESITINFGSKKPGYGFEIEERNFGFVLHEDVASGAGEYEKLLLDCIFGDQTLFTSTEEVRAMWRFIDPIIEAWGKI